MSKPQIDFVPNVAIIGAGISGLVAARTLAAQGMPVTIFEKSRGVGGRMATRRFENGSSFDHGAQYFTVRDSRFQRHVDPWIEQGIVAQWPNESLGADQQIVVIRQGKIEFGSKSATRFVGVPAMNSICKFLAGGLDIRKQTRAEKVNQVDRGIALFDDQDNALGVFDRLLVSAPAEQTAKLLVDFPSLAEQILMVKMNPCWAAMAVLEKPVTNKWVGAFIHESFLSWSARNNRKPGRTNISENLVIHAGPDWTSQNWDRDSADVAGEMLEEFWSVAGVPRQHPVQLTAHRWKYAIPVEPFGQHCFYDESAGIGACGDWAGGSRIEGAFLSGIDAADRIFESAAKSIANTKDNRS